MKAGEACRKLYAETSVPVVTVGGDGRVADAERLGDRVENSGVAVGEEAECPVPLRVARLETAVAIRLEDPGVGVPRAHRDALFEPFTERCGRDVAAVL